MTEGECRQFHEALCGMGRVLFDLVFWFEDFLKGLKDETGAALRFSRYGESNDPLSAGSLSWLMDEAVNGKQGKFRIRADLVMHDGRNGAEAKPGLPAVIWQIIATSTRQSQNLELRSLSAYPLLCSSRSPFVPKLHYFDESGGRSSFYRRVYLISSPMSLHSRRDAYRTSLHEMINAMQSNRFFRSYYEARFAEP